LVFIAPYQICEQIFGIAVQVNHVQIPRFF
jgi:hypothetical protein